MYCNSIYETLRELAGVNNPKKLAVAYVNASLRRCFDIRSRDPIIDEGQKVYVILDRMGRTILHTDEGQEAVIGIIKSRLSDNGYTPKKGTVEETVITMFNKFEFEEALGNIGEALHKLVKEKPHFTKPIEEITAGQIQRYEQKQIKKELSEYLS